MSQSNRAGITGVQRTRLLQEALGKCPYCGLELIGSLQIHHIDRNPKNTVDDNLMALCASCHDQVTKHLIPDSEIPWRKMALKNGVHPFGDPKPGMNVSSTDNRGGVIAQEIHGKIVIQGPTKSGPIVIPGSLVANPAHYRYVEYLIKQLTDFRRAGASFGQRRTGQVHAGGTRKIIQNEFGNLPKDLPVERFDEVVLTLKARIDNTALGRRNHSKGIRNYHAFEEHGAV